MKLFNKYQRLTTVLVIITVLAAFMTAGCGDTEVKEEKIRLATAAEWTERADGLPNFEKHYGFEFPRSNLVVVELGLAYQAVGTGQAEVGIGDATEGRIAQYNLKVLEDDKLFFPAYNPAPLVRKEILDIYPELEDILGNLSALLDLNTLTDLNKIAAVDGEQPEEVARNFLLENNLIDDSNPVADPEKTTPVVVSGKTFTEALTLGSMTVYLLEYNGFMVVNEIGLGEVAMIRPALESGAIDLYWEYTGTGLMNVMGHDEVVTDPQECYELVRDWDLENHNIVWLPYAPANNTFVLFISEEVDSEYGWNTISDMVDHINRYR